MSKDSWLAREQSAQERAIDVDGAPLGHEAVERRALGTLDVRTAVSACNAGSSRPRIPRAMSSKGSIRASFTRQTC